MFLLQKIQKLKKGINASDTSTQFSHIERAHFGINTCPKKLNVKEVKLHCTYALSFF